MRSPEPQRLSTIRARGAFHLHRGRAEDGSARLLITGAKRRDVEAVRRCLARVADAHRSLRIDGVATLAESDLEGPSPFVALACDPIADGERVIARLGELGQRVSYAEAIAVVERVGRVLEAGHASSSDGGPHALGGLGWANVLIDANGSLSLVGFGHQIVGRDEHGVPSGAASFFAPPELARGGEPTSSSDAYGFVMLQRSVIGYAELPEALAGALSGHAGASPVERELSALVEASTTNVLACAPWKRDSMQALRTRWEREWELVGARPDPIALATRLRSVLTEEPLDLCIASDGSWLQRRGEAPVPLGGRGPLKRVLVCLVNAHRQERRVSVDEIVAAGWPGDRSRRPDALNRAYVAISELRRLGPPHWLERDDAGYRVRPDLVIGTLNPQQP